ncbi:hypothetical protein Agabi119p4_2335 [Agaricus bisporus var. burnettii]|uniref:Uncharacterized protein n=1 Tax=Agaricus bisporus var. burnettii TaxID=192524 RepID=A0A8H7F8Z3_AGABI|nr:hypothetical protein Agabi119p4_2335 [Agaricus bisporus var. burnettii]
MPPQKLRRLRRLSYLDDISPPTEPSRTRSGPHVPIFNEFGQEMDPDDPEFPLVQVDNRPYAVRHLENESRLATRVAPTLTPVAQASHSLPPTEPRHTRSGPRVPIFNEFGQEMDPDDPEFPLVQVDNRPYAVRHLENESRLATRVAPALNPVAQAPKDQGPSRSIAGSAGTRTRCSCKPSRPHQGWKHGLPEAIGKRDAEEAISIAEIDQEKAGWEG